VTVPYAFKADLALTVPDGSITNAKIATGTITADRFASGIFNPSPGCWAATAAQTLPPTTLGRRTISRS